MYSTPFRGSSRVLRSLAILAPLVFTAPVMSQFTIPGTEPAAQESGNTLVQAEAVAGATAIVAGETFMLGVRYAIKPGWHIYWRNAGESGAPTELALTLPEGFTAGAIQWPRPEVFTSMGDTSFGYGRETMLFVPIKAPATITGESVTIGIATAWLVCKDVCLFGEAELTLTVPVARGGDVVRLKRDQQESFFSRMLARVPRPLESMPGTSALLQATSDGTVLKISGPARRGAEVRFLPDHTPGVRYQGKAPYSARTSTSGFVIEVPLDIEPDDALGKPLRAAGIIILGKGKESPALEVAVPIPTKEEGIRRP